MLIRFHVNVTSNILIRLNFTTSSDHHSTSSDHHTTLALLHINNVIHGVRYRLVSLFAIKHSLVLKFKLIRLNIKLLLRSGLVCDKVGLKFSLSQKLFLIIHFLIQLVVLHRELVGGAVIELVTLVDLGLVHRDDSMGSLRRLNNLGMNWDLVEGLLGRGELLIDSRSHFLDSGFAVQSLSDDLVGCHECVELSG